MKCTLLSFLFLIVSASAVLAKRYTDTEMKAMFIERTLPEYPYQLRARGITGAGIFRLFINEQGKVTAIKILESTRHPELDKAAMVAMVRWRAKPGSKREVDHPVTFTVRGR